MVRDLLIGFAASAVALAIYAAERPEIRAEMVARWEQTELAGRADAAVAWLDCATHSARSAITPAFGVAVDIALD